MRLNAIGITKPGFPVQKPQKCRILVRIAVQLPRVGVSLAGWCFMYFRRFLASQSGAVAVDWVVLSAAIVGMGIASVAAVRTGVEALGHSIGKSLSDAEVLVVGPFVFLHFSAEQQQSILETFRGRNNNQVRSNSLHSTNIFLASIETGDLGEAQRWMEHRQLNQIVLDERGLAPHDDALSVNRMRQILAQARAD